MTFGLSRRPVTPLFEATGEPVEVRSSADLVDAGLVDLRRLEPYWQSLIANMHLAVSQRYPIGVSALTRVIDVAQFRSGQHEVRAASLRSRASHPTFDYLVWNREYFGTRTDVDRVLRIFGRDVATGNHAPTDRPDLSLTLHEVLHPLFDVAIELNEFRNELSDAISPVLGVRWNSKTHGNEKVQEALRKTLGAYATTGFEEAGVEALANGILHGKNATPVGRAAQAVFDKWFRHDSPGVEALAHLILRREGGLRLDGRSSVKRELRSLGTGSVPEWKPLDLSGQSVGEGTFQAYRLDSRALKAPTPDFPDAFFGEVIDGIGVSAYVSWRQGSFLSEIPSRIWGPSLSRTLRHLK